MRKDLPLPMPTETVLRDQTSGAILVPHLTIAQTFFAQLRGLLGRKDLPLGEGLLITPCRAIHTCFMRFTIDAVFIDRAGKIVKICSQVKPWRLAAANAYAVIELPATGAAQWQVGAGVSWK
jgi:uncharacterized membrane protein (UPF0127 family)